MTIFNTNPVSLKAVAEDLDLGKGRMKMSDYYMRSRVPAYVGNYSMSGYKGAAAGITPALGGSPNLDHLERYWNYYFFTETGGEGSGQFMYCRFINGDVTGNSGIEAVGKTAMDLPQGYNIVTAVEWRQKHNSSSYMDYTVVYNMSAYTSANLPSNASIDVSAVGYKDAYLEGEPARFYTQQNLPSSVNDRSFTFLANPAFPLIKVQFFAAMRVGTPKDCQYGIKMRKFSMKLKGTHRSEPYPPSGDFKP